MRNPGPVDQLILLQEHYHIVCILRRESKSLSTSRSCFLQHHSEPLLLYLPLSLSTYAKSSAYFHHQSPSDSQIEHLRLFFLLLSTVSPEPVRPEASSFLLQFGCSFLIRHHEFLTLNFGLCISMHIPTYLLLHIPTNFAHHNRVVCFLHPVVPLPRFFFASTFFLTPSKARIHTNHTCSI